MNNIDFIIEQIEKDLHSEEPVEYIKVGKWKLAKGGGNGLSWGEWVKATKAGMYEKALHYGKPIYRLHPGNKWVPLSNDGLLVDLAKNMGYSPHSKYKEALSKVGLDSYDGLENLIGFSKLPLNFEKEFLRKAWAAMEGEKEKRKRQYTQRDLPDYLKGTVFDKNR